MKDKPPHVPINRTLEEEQRRRTRTFHIHVIGLKEGDKPEDGRALSELMGLKSAPFVAAWGVQKKHTHIAIKMKHQVQAERGTRRRRGFKRGQ